MKQKYILFFVCLFLFNVGYGQKETPSFDKIYQREIPVWFNEAKFGIFVVWGIYSVPGWAPKGEYAEWYGARITSNGNKTKEYHEEVWGEDFSYDQFVPFLHGEGFNAEEWTRLFQKSGAKYVVTCANYHDGFAMYPTNYAVSKFGENWNAFERGPKRDVLHELNEAGTAKGLKMGIYYSVYEWWHPLYLEGEFEKYSLDFFHPKFKEVVSKYKPPVIFLDGEWDQSYKTWHSEELANWLYTESPVKDEVVVNDRWGQVRSQYGDYYSSEYGGGNYSPDHPWQEDRGIGKSYGYNRNEDVWDYNSRGELLHLLSTVCSNGGNLLLDIGPKADGRIPPIMQERLLQIGEWLDKNGEAIYGTSASPFWPRQFDWGVCTEKDHTLFLHLFDTAITSLKIQGIFNEIKSVNFLATEESLKFEKFDNDLYIDITPMKPDADVNIIAVTIEGKIKVDKRPHQFQNKNIVILAWAFKIHGSTTKTIFNGYDRIAHISNWTDCEDYISCEFVTSQPGDYEVFVNYCSDATSSGSELKVLINSDTINFTSENTGGWKGKNYKTKKCGLVTIEKEGEQQITVKPSCGKWKNMAIKEIIFTLK
jgi:alpha-L-fucosidase